MSEGSNMFEAEDVQEHHLVPIQDGAILQIEKAQIDMQISTAKKYPRNIQRAKKKYDCVGNTR